MPKYLSDHYCILVAKNKNDRVVTGLQILPYTACYLVSKLRYMWNVKKKMNKKYIIGSFYFPWPPGKNEVFHNVHTSIDDIYDKSIFDTKKLIMNDVIPDEYGLFLIFCPNLNFIFDNI